jgi:hypothetical protein
MLVNKTLYNGILGTGHGCLGLTILGTNYVVKTKVDPTIPTSNPPFNCQASTVRWRRVNEAYIPANTVCELEIEKRIKP